MAGSKGQKPSSRPSDRPRTSLDNIPRPRRHGPEEDEEAQPTIVNIVDIMHRRGTVQDTSEEGADHPKSIQSAWGDFNNLTEDIGSEGDAYPTPEFTGNISDILTKEVFRDMRHDVVTSGVDRKQFAMLIRKHTGHKISADVVDGFYAKLEIGQGEKLQWDQLAGYMYLVLGEQDAAAARARSIDLIFPADAMSSPHPQPVIRVSGGRRQIYSMCENATLALWPGSIKERSAYKPSRILNLDFDSDYGDEAPPGARQITWATDFTIMPQMGRLVVSSGERKLYFYDSYGDYALQFVITHLENVPTRLCQTFSQSMNASVLMWGDSAGSLGALIFPKYYSSSQHFRMHMLKGQEPRRISIENLEPTVNALREYGGVHVRNWHGHSEWVNELKWIESNNMFVSVSGDPNTSMIVGEPIDLISHPPTSLRNSLIQRRESSIRGLRVNSRQVSFSVVKGGIRVVDFSSSLGLLATGGTDRIVRCWSPHVTRRPESILYGHEAAIVALSFKSDENGNGKHKELMSLDRSNTIRVWDVKAQVSILTISPQLHGMPDDPSCIFYGQDTKALLLFPKSKVGVIRVKPGRNSGQGLSHLSPIQCGLFNKRFSQMVTADSEGVIKSWDIRTGAVVFEFRADQNTGASINSMTLDHTSTKLITAFDNGQTSRWQYSTGQHLNTFKETKTDEKPEVTKVLFISSGQMHSVLTVGWSKKVTIYRDRPASEHTQDIYPVNDNWISTNRHKDDITAACKFGRITLATGAYNGDVILWNLSTGNPRKLPTRAEMEKHVKPTELQEYTVLALASIPSRIDERSMAQLIVSTTTGLYFWNVRNGHHGSIVGLFTTDDDKHVEANALALSEDCKTLLVGDAAGRISAYDIEHYASSEIQETSAPPLLKRWRAHNREKIQELTYIQRQASELDRIDTIEPTTETDLADSADSTSEESPACSDSSKLSTNDFVVSSSHDCRARLWTADGRFVGTFGQDDEWNWQDEDTWQESDTPFEIQVADAARLAEVEQDSKLDQMAEMNNTRITPAPAWGLGDFDVSSPSESALWRTESPPEDFVNALTGSSKIAMMKYIGAGGGASGNGFYARRSLDASKKPPPRTMSAPAGLQRRISIMSPPTLSQTQSRRSSSRGLLSSQSFDPSLPRKVGNNERSVQAQHRRISLGLSPSTSSRPGTATRRNSSEAYTKAIYDDTKDKLAAASPELHAFDTIKIPATPEIDDNEPSLSNDDEVPRLTITLKGNFSPRKNRARAHSAAAPGRRVSESFNRYRDSVPNIPDSLLKADEDARKPRSTEGFEAYAVGARAVTSARRSRRQSMAVTPSMSP